MAELPAGSIDRVSPIPFYFQLKKLLADEIVANRWSHGDRIPSEPAICEHFSVSRTTVRQALAELEAEGLVRRDKGRGTFVRVPASSSWLLQSSHGFYDEAVRGGHKVLSRVLRAEIEELPHWAAHALRLTPSSHGVTVERLRWIDDRLAMYVLNHLPQELAETVLGADLTNGSLYRVLEARLGLAVFGGRRVVEAVPAHGELARLLEVDDGAPLLFVESVSWDERGQPFECYRAWHRADFTKIEVQVVHEDVATRAGVERTSLQIAG